MNNQVVTQKVYDLPILESKIIIEERDQSQLTERACCGDCKNQKTCKSGQGKHTDHSENHHKEGK